jgi:hypothetical protein
VKGIHDTSECVLSWNFQAFDGARQGRGKSDVESNYEIPAPPHPPARPLLDGVCVIVSFIYFSQSITQTKNFGYFASAEGGFGLVEK